MRLLVVDAGNTNVVFGLWEGDTFAGSWRLATARERTADEYGILARQLLGDRGPVDAAIVGSVVPPLNGTIRAMLETHFGVEPLFLEPGVRTGLAIQTENPLEVGADRIANAVAAHARFGGPTIVVDFGTATTFDLVSAKGEYRGGIISPGIGVASEALFARAARLPRIDVRRPATLIGTNTVASLESGIYYGYLGLVDGILERMKREIGDVKAVVATGRPGSSLIEESAHIQHYAPELTLEGLKIVYERHSARKAKKHA
ncbi:MAG: type III pantothenate kinase [Thermoanaerobaculia bacterium]